MNITRLTQKYIREHPSIADCLSSGLINYSALAREICHTHEVNSFDAVLIACRRHRAKQNSRTPHEKKIMALIRKAKVRVRNKIVVITIEKGRVMEKALELQNIVKRQKGDFNLIEGEDVITIVTNIEYLPAVKETFRGRVKKITRDVVQISMIFDQNIETTSGVVAHIYRLFADNDINIREEMSCWTDVMVIIDEKDIGRAMQILSV